MGNNNMFNTAGECWVAMDREAANSEIQFAFKNME
jgi:hypothetical protein